MSTLLWWLKRSSWARPFKKTFYLGRSEREPEAYGSRYVEGLSEASGQEKGTGYFSIPLIVVWPFEK
jgi:hypothetical protein